MLSSGRITTITVKLKIILFLSLVCPSAGYTRCLSRTSVRAPRCRTSQYRSAFMLLSVSLWNDLADPVFDGVGLAGFQSRANAFFIGLSCSIPTAVIYYFYISLSVYTLVLWGWGLRTDRVYITLSQPCTADIF